MEILKTSALSKRYGHTEVLKGVDMSVNEGDIYGFVGRNGAGKSTFMKVITGLVSVSGGGFTLFDVPNTSKDITGARRKMSGIIESPAYYPHMSAFDNLKVQMLSVGEFDETRILDALKSVGLKNRKTRVKNFSLGMKQRLSIAQAIMNNSRFVILDEPTNGLDPQGIIKLRELIKRMNTERGITFLISSHYLTELEQIVNRIGILRDGKIVAENDIAAFADKDFEQTIISLIGEEGDEDAAE
jgi:ABC-2 type transport system ATP-binding protein